jgi:predicted metal-binding protein
MASQSGFEKYSFLVKLALDNGAADAKIIPAAKVVVEDRVVLKCKIGCNNYGKTLACPPYTPSAEEFRKIVSEYSYAMFMKFNQKPKLNPKCTSSFQQLKSTPPSQKKSRRK